MTKEEEANINRLIETGHPDNLNIAFNCLLGLGFDKPNAVLKMARRANVQDYSIVSETQINGVFFEFTLIDEGGGDIKTYIHVHNCDEMYCFRVVKTTDVWWGDDMVGPVTKSAYLHHLKDVFVDSEKEWGQYV